MVILYMNVVRGSVCALFVFTDLVPLAVIEDLHPN